MEDSTMVALKLQGATRCGPDWLWTYNGILLWMDGMLYLTAFGNGDCWTCQSSTNLATRYKARQLLVSKIMQSAQDDDERGRGVHTRIF